MTNDILDTPFTEIADQIRRDTAQRARLDAETDELVRAIELLRPYMQDSPDRTVREALELMRADLAAANQAAPAEAQAVVLLPAPVMIQVSRDRHSRADDEYMRVDFATASDLRAQARLSRRGSFRRTWAEGVLAEYGEQLTDGVRLGDVWPALREAITNRGAAAFGATAPGDNHA